MKTQIVNIKRVSFNSSTLNDVYIGRGRNYGYGLFGNPYTVKVHGRTKCIQLYREYFYNRIRNDPGFKESILALKGKRLGCHCKPKPCHGDIIVEYLENKQKIEEEKDDDSMTLPKIP